MFRTITLAAVGVLAFAATATAQRPHPDLPYTTVSRIDPWTGAYSNTEYFYDVYSGRPTERGYWQRAHPVPPVGVYSPPTYGTGYDYAPPLVVHYPPSYGWPPPPRVLAGPRHWRR